jgi:hypothetical protein
LSAAEVRKGRGILAAFFINSSHYAATFWPKECLTRISTHCQEPAKNVHPNMGEKTLGIKLQAEERFCVVGHGHKLVVAAGSASIRACGTYRVLLDAW